MNNMIIKTGTPLMSISAATLAAVAGVVAASYVPKFFVSEGIEVHKNQLAKYIDAKKIDVPKDVREFIDQAILTGACIPYSLELHSKYTQNFFAWFNNITKQIWEFTRVILGVDKKKKATMAYNNIVRHFETMYDDYNMEHEYWLMDIQSNIDKINKTKPVIKDYILKKLSIKMQEMGVKSKLSDYPMEHIDTRLFSLKDEYDIIKQEKLKIEKEAEDLLDYIPQLAFYNFIKANTLRKKTDKLRIEGGLIEKKIRADLKKLENISVALDNISQIFIEIENSYIPIIERILKDIDTKYNNCYDDIPDAEISFLYASSKILKEITEKRILKEGFGMEDVKPVIKYSNKLSKDYCELKKTFDSVAGEAA